MSTCWRNACTNTCSSTSSMLTIDGESYDYQLGSSHQLPSRDRTMDNVTIKRSRFTVSKLLCFKGTSSSSDTTSVHSPCKSSVEEDSLCDPINTTCIGNHTNHIESSNHVQHLLTKQTPSEQQEILDTVRAEIVTPPEETELLESSRLLAQQDHSIRSNSPENINSHDLEDKHSLCTSNNPSPHMAKPPEDSVDADDESSNILNSVSAPEEKLEAANEGIYYSINNSTTSPNEKSLLRLTRMDSVSSEGALSPLVSGNTPGPILDNDGFSYQLTFPPNEIKDSTPMSVLTQPLVLGPSMSSADVGPSPSASITAKSETISTPTVTPSSKKTGKSSDRPTRSMSNSRIKSPDGRYLKQDEEVGRGSFKTVYKGLDCETGVNVAWCELMDKKWNASDQRMKFKEEVEMLKGLQHPNILRFYDSWEYVGPNHRHIIVLITELMTSGTLKHYIRKFRKISIKLIANWCRQILKGLHFLHTRSPPVIHRDLKCDNLFINGQSGCVKIGDLGLAVLKNQAYAKSVIGTPEFMAPEMYDEKYDEKADIYAFGMCMLEMATSEYPYKECKNFGQIYRKVTTGVRPESFYRVNDPAISNIIDNCIQVEPKDRMTAKELLQLDFFNEWSVHVDCQATPSLNILLFRVKDDIKSREDPHRLDEVVQFDFNLERDSIESVIKDMVNSGYLCEGNMKVTGKIMQEKLDMHRHSHRLPLADPQVQHRRYKSLDDTMHLNSDIRKVFTVSKDRKKSDSESVSLSRPPSKILSSISVPAIQAENGSESTTSRNQEYEHGKSRHTAYPTRKKKPQVIINDMVTEDGALIVNCQLQTGKATVTFNFNCENDTAGEITENLSDYLQDSDHQAIVKDQIQFIIHLVSEHKDKHKDHPDLVKALYNTKRQQQQAALASRSSAQDEETVYDSRNNSKDLEYTEEETSINIPNAASPINQILNRSFSNELPADKGDNVESRSIAQSKDVKLSLPLRSPTPPFSSSSQLISNLDDFHTRTRSTTWSVQNSQSPSNKFLYPPAFEQTIIQPPSVAARPTNLPLSKTNTMSATLSQIKSAPSTPMNQRRLPKQPQLPDISAPTPNEDQNLKPEESLRISQLKKGFDITELSKSIETIMHAGKDDKSAALAQANQQARRRKVSAKPDGYTSPPDSLTNMSMSSNPTSNSSSLTYDSFNTPFSPPISRLNSVGNNYPVAPTTKKIGRFAIGMVQEEIASSNTVTSSSSNLIADKSSINNNNQPNELNLLSKCYHCHQEAVFEEDPVYQELLARQAEEVEKLAERQKQEIEVYMVRKNALCTYPEICSECSALQNGCNDQNVLCELHQIANKVQQISAITKVPMYNESLTDCHSDSPNIRSERSLGKKDLVYATNYLRSGRHCNNNTLSGRKRHNSVEQIIQRVLSIDEEVEIPSSPSAKATRTTITEEEDAEGTNVLHTRIKSIREEVSQSWQGVIRSLQGQATPLSEGKPYNDASSMSDRSPTSQKFNIRQALDSSRNQIIKSINTIRSDQPMDIL